MYVCVCTVTGHTSCQALGLNTKKHVRIINNYMYMSIYVCMIRSSDDRRAFKHCPLNFANLWLKISTGH